MPQSNTPGSVWAVIAIACLALGVAVGYVISGSRRAQPAIVVTPSPGATAPSPGATPPPATAPSSVQPGALVDERQVQALRTILAQDPKNARAAKQLGNLLYDAGRYVEAVPVYQQAFALDPSDANLSTDLGTALWYAGRPDEALAQYEKSLTIDPSHGHTLFNKGIVLNDGKLDAPQALQAWERLLATNPNYPERAKVEQLMEQTRQRITSTPVAPVRSTR